MCRNCIFELAYAIALGRPEPQFRITTAMRAAAMEKIERAGLRAFGTSKEKTHAQKT